VVGDDDGVDGVCIMEGAADAPPISPKDAARIFPLIRKDELRCFDRKDRDFVFKVEETLAVGKASLDVGVFRFLVRRPSTSHEAFLRHWNGAYAEAAQRALKTVSYVGGYRQNTVTVAQPPHYPFDGISELWFSSLEDATRSFLERDLAPLSQDLTAFCDMTKSITVLTQLLLKRRPATDYKY